MATSTDPALADVTNFLAAFQANPTAANLATLNTAVDDYQGESGLWLPDALQTQVDAANAVSVIPGTGVTTTIAPASTPGMLSSSGLRLGSIVIPWVGVAAIALFVGAAIYLGKPHRSRSSMWE